MVSTGQNTFFGKILRLGYPCGFTQIKWDRKRNIWKYEMNVLRQVWVRIQLAMVVAYDVFLVYKGWLVYNDPNMGPGQIIRIQYFIFQYVLINVNHLVGVFNGVQYVGLLNSYPGFVKAYLQNGIKFTNNDDLKS